MNDSLSNSIPDPVFRSRLCQILQLPEEEITFSILEGIQTFSFSREWEDQSEAIKSFQGIEYLSDLRSFTCFNTSSQLKSLDISRCKSLQDLDCSCNQIRKIDISQNLELKSLFMCQTRPPDLFHTEESDYIPIIVKSPVQYLRNYPADEDDGGWLAGCKGYMWIYYDE